MLPGRKPQISGKVLDGSKYDSPPSLHEVEVSVFGPGYGESIVLHLGQNNWFIIDSCIDPTSREPAPIKYLTDISANPALNVKQIVTTHWHDDHVRGLGAMLDVCASAEFVCSTALRSKEFTDLVCALSDGAMIESSGLDEFSKVMKILQCRKESSRLNYAPKFAVSDRILWEASLDALGSECICRVLSLSPSDASIFAASMDFRRYLPKEKEAKRRIPAITPNRSAVVLLVAVGGLSILLGSDLEEEKDASRGWSVIVNSSIRPASRASLHKIPHHGSMNAHHPGVWSTMLTRDPLAVLSPFGWGNVDLPTRGDVDRICSLTPNAYSTAKYRDRKPKKRDSTVEKTIRETVKQLRQTNTSVGHVRFRAKKADSWKIELFGDARPLSRLSST